MQGNLPKRQKNFPSQNRTGFLSNDLFFNTILLLLRTFWTWCPSKKCLWNFMFSQEIDNLLRKYCKWWTPPPSSRGHSWDIWVNWIATKWPQFIHCFSFFRSCTTVTLFVGLVHHHWNSQKKEKVTEQDCESLWPDLRFAASAELPRRSLWCSKFSMLTIKHIPRG